MRKLSGIRLSGIRRFLVVGLALTASCVPAWGRYQPPPPCKNPFTVEQEISEGGKVAAQVYKQMPVLPDSDPVTRYVQQLGARLVAHAPGYKWPFNFHVVASSDINAFALPGGSMFVNLGTIQAAQTEAQLAGVMAHEMSHVILRHSTCNMAKQQNKSILYGIGSIASQILLGNGTAGQLAQQGIGLGAGLDFLHMSRGDEQQADLLGTDILYDSGYDPRGLPQFFETIQAKYGSGGAQWLSDHPNPGNRTQYVDAEIATLPRQPGAKVTSPEFARVRELALKEKTYAAKEVEAGTWRRTGAYASGPGAGPGIVAAPVSATAQPGAAQSGGNGGGGAARLSAAALGNCGSMVPLQGTRFSIAHPPCWKAATDQAGNATIAPEGGVTAGGVTYGAVLGFEKKTGDGVGDAASLKAATDVLYKRLSQENGGLQQVGQLRELTIGRQIADAVELRGRSAVVDGGTQLAERDWLITVARPDGDLNYMVFVAPEADFETLRPVFTEMMKSFRAQ
jgi:hypothetical protein